MRTRTLRRALTNVSLTLFCALAGAAFAAPPDLTIVNAGVDQVSPEAVQLWMEMSSPPEAKPGPEERTYVWFIDTDRDATTGQKHRDVGSEFNVRVVFGAGGRLVGAHIERIGGGPGPRGVAHIAGNRVTMRVRLDEMEAASGFDWTCSCSTRGAASGPLPRRSFRAGSPTASEDRPARVIVQPLVSLSGGTTSAVPKVSAWDASGNAIDLSKRKVVLFAMPPAAVTVQGRTLKATPGRAAPGWYTAAVDGIVSANTGQLMVGSVDLTPPIQHLNLGDNSKGRIKVDARDAAGSVIPPDGHAVAFHMRGTGVVSVGSDGAVTALPGSAGKGEWLTADFDGVTCANTALVRVSGPQVTIPPTAAAKGKHVTLWHPSYGDDAPPALRFGKAIRDHSIVQALDRVYEEMQAMSGVQPWRGGTQHISVVATGPLFSVCGGSGNTVQAGFSLNGPGCFLIGDSGVPHWGVVAHEMGHNFVFELGSLDRALCRGQRPGNPAFAYSEGLATIFALAAMGALSERADGGGLPPIVTSAWKDGSVYGSVAMARRTMKDEALGKYVHNGARYLQHFDPSVLDGMLFTIADEHGWGVFHRFFRIFCPGDEGLGFTPANETQRATFFVAAMSVAADTDLRRRFRTWGFPVDDSLYTRLRPALARRLAQPAP